MKRKHCFDSVGQWSVSGDAAGDTGRGTPYESGTRASHPEERQWSLGVEAVAFKAGVWPVPHVEFNDEPGEAGSSLRNREERKRIFS